MKKLLTIYVFLISGLLAGCRDEPQGMEYWYENFDTLVEIIDTHYCFFEEKDIDWAEITAEYRTRINPEMTVLEFFNLCAYMLDELKDGHVNLSSNFNTSYYKEWWTDYPQDFNLRTLQQYYLDFDYMQTSGISYKIFDDNIGYMYYPSFSAGISKLNLDYILAYLSDCKALIIDIRNNGGGLLTNIDVLVSRFITQPVCGGYITHKTGPGHNDFSEPYPIIYKPAEDGRVMWGETRPVYVLTNRACFSSANDFVSVMKSLPQVKIIGARTGGGGGLPFSSEISCGWAVRFSAAPLYSPDGTITEFGIDPSEGYEVHCSDEQLAIGIDAILDFALEEARMAPEP